MDVLALPSERDLIVPGHRPFDTILPLAVTRTLVSLKTSGFYLNHIETFPDQTVTHSLLHKSASSLCLSLHLVVNREREPFHRLYQC